MRLEQDHKWRIGLEEVDIYLRQGKYHAVYDGENACYELLIPAPSNCSLPIRIHMSRRDIEGILQQLTQLVQEAGE